MQGQMGSTGNVRPVGPPDAYQSFVISAPRGGGRDYWRRASCAEVGCERWRDGFMVVCDESTTLGARQAAYIRQWSERSFSEGAVRVVDDPEGLRQEWSPVVRPGEPTAFRFPAGQTCFEEHQVRTGRPGIYLVRHGDFRRGSGINRSVIRTYDQDYQWVHDFAEHQDNLIELQRQG